MIKITALNNRVYITDFVQFMSELHQICFFDKITSHFIFLSMSDIDDITNA